MKKLTALTLIFYGAVGCGGIAGNGPEMPDPSSPESPIPHVYQLGSAWPMIGAQGREIGVFFRLELLTACPDRSDSPPHVYLERAGTEDPMALAGTFTAQEIRAANAQAPKSATLIIEDLGKRLFSGSLIFSGQEPESPDVELPINTLGLERGCGEI